jgi:hypothetical protein
MICFEMRTIQQKIKAIKSKKYIGHKMRNVYKTLARNSEGKETTWENLV